MAIIKFNSPENQFNKSIKGQTFYSGNKTSTMRNKAQMRMRRSEKQMLMNAFLISASQYYRDLSPEEQELWNTFATLLPQQTMRDEYEFLTGYEIFVKRNQHLKIFKTDAPGFMESPSLDEVFADFPIISVYVNSARLIFSAVYPRGNSDLDCLIGLSGLISPGISFLGSGSRLVLNTKNVTENIDITDQYLAVYKTIPPIDQIIQCSIIEIGTLNGQYFFMPAIKIIVSPYVTPVPTIHNIATTYTTDVGAINVSELLPLDWFQIIQIPAGLLSSISFSTNLTGNPSCTLSLDIYSVVDGHENELLSSSLNLVSFPNSLPNLKTFNFDPISLPKFIAFKLKIAAADIYSDTDFINYQVNDLSQYEPGKMFYYLDGTIHQFLNISLVGYFSTI